jgi:hypothetical protein
MSRGIYSDPGLDHIARASESRQMSWVVGWTNGWVQEYPEWWLENRPEHQTEKCPVNNVL